MIIIFCKSRYDYLFLNMKFRQLVLIGLVLLGTMVSAKLSAQETFIKRYKNSSLPEGSVAVAPLPNGKIAIIGGQSNGFEWQAPIVIITDSAGNQLQHFMDSACWSCSVMDATTDSKGFIYAVGNFYGKAGVVKYDTLGNKIWQQAYILDEQLSSVFYCIEMVEDSLIIVGGSQATDDYGGCAIVVLYNLSGDTICSNYFPYSSTTGVLDISYEWDKLYVTGVRSDTIPPYQKVFFAEVGFSGQPILFQELPIGRKMGYGIVPLAPDTILIGGYSRDMYQLFYCFVAIVDSNGLVLETIEDSTYLDNFSTKMRFDRETQLFYMMNKAEKIYQNGSNILPEKISAYTMPITNLQQPLWEKTITNAHNGGSLSGDLNLYKDSTLLHTSGTIINCPHCPYLLKTDANTCADLVLCDTAFVSSVSIAEAIDASLRIYPNPFAGGSLHYQLESSRAINNLSLQCVAIDGRYIANHIEQTNSYMAGEIHFDEVLPSGVYFLQFLLNGQHKLYSRVVKIE